MKPQWWGILGLIGWAYFFSCEFYLLSRGKLAAVLAFLVFCVAYYAIAHRGGLPSPVGWLFSQGSHAAHSEIVLAGIACTLIFFDATRPDSNRRRFLEALAFGIALVVAAFLLRPYFKISKIYATPSWCLYCAAICVAVFAFLYWLIDVKGRDGWTRLVEPAASSPLVTYLLPFVIAAVLSIVDLHGPAWLDEGAVGLAWAAFYSCLIVWLVSLLNKRGVRLKI